VIEQAQPLSSRHVSALDGVRGIAILAVTAFHFVWQANQQVPSTQGCRLLTRVADLGTNGVDLFFVLSGYLITGILLDTKNSPRFFRNFYARRFLRIFPLYYAFLTLLLVAAPIFFPDSALVRQAGRNQAWVWLYATNIKLALADAWAFCGAPVCGQGIELNHTWSLAVEEHFYLVWPLVVFCCSRRRLMHTCAALFLLALFFRLRLRNSWFAMYALTPCRMDTLATGAFVAAAERELGLAWLLRVDRLPASVAALAFAVIVGLPGGPAGRVPAVQAATFSVTAVLAATLIVSALASRETGARGRIARALDHPVLRTFGKYSYGLYLFHSALRPLLMRIFPADRMADALRSPALGIVAYYVLATTSCLGLAWCSYHLFEKHLLRLKVYFADRADGLAGRAEVLATTASDAAQGRR